MPPFTPPTDAPVEPLLKQIDLKRHANCRARDDNRPFAETGRRSKRKDAHMDLLYYVIFGE